MTPSSSSGRPVGGVILFHGAGGDRNHRLFLALEQTLDVPVARINFPYRDKGPGRRPPDRMPRLIDAVNRAVADHAKVWNAPVDRVVIGGRSMGGRAASMAVAEGLGPAGLLLLSYPLHPTGKPEKLRVDHFGAIDCPTLLVQGTRDPMGKPDEFARYLPTIAGPLTESWIDANHSPGEKLDDDIVATVTSWLADL